MRNISINGEEINLDPDKYYYIIDALYLNIIKNEIINNDIINNEIINNDILDKEIEDKIFPYTDAPFAKIRIGSSFSVQNIKRANYEEVNSETKVYFSSDTGLIIFIAEEIFGELLKDFDYDNLVDSITEDSNSNYWDRIVSNYNINDIGLIMAPGVDSNYEFTGSGIYRIQTSLL